MDGTLDVRTLWLLDSTIRIGVARGGERGVGWRAYPPPCGQLTRCFSAVAELLVIQLMKVRGMRSCLNYKTEMDTDIGKTKFSKRLLGIYTAAKRRRQFFYC